MAGFETSHWDACKPPAEGSCWNHTGKDILADSAQLAFGDEEFEDIIPIYDAAVISDDHEDERDHAKCYKAATESPLAKNWDMAMKEELDAIGQHQVFGDFVDFLERRKALPSHWVYKIMRDGAGNVQWFKARLVCAGNPQIEGIDYQATYAPTRRLGDISLALAIAAVYNPEIHQMEVCIAFFGSCVGWRDVYAPTAGTFSFGRNRELIKRSKINKDFAEDGTPLEKVSFTPRAVFARLVQHF